MKNTLITGITGQDGSYLAELLLEKGYQVYGLVLPGQKEPVDNVRHLLDSVTLVRGDLTDQASLDAAVRTTQPDELYNLAAQSFVPASWEDPALTEGVTGLGVARLLDSVRKYAPRARFFQASSAQIFGHPAESPQTEATAIRPRNPYGASKAYAHFMVQSCRERYGLFACSGILYNHESPRRGMDFVVRKVTHAAARIKLGLQTELRMGNMDAVRDWGFAGDYVQAMWLMLQQDKPEDFVIASGQARTVRELVETAFGCAGLDWKRHVVRDESLVRPEEPVPIIGDASKAHAALGWAPSVSFLEMISMMVREDIKSLAGLPTQEVRS